MNCWGRRGRESGFSLINQDLQELVVCEFWEALTAPAPGEVTGGSDGLLFPPLTAMSQGTGSELGVLFLLSDTQQCC